jgi:hypothetical protein
VGCGSNDWGLILDVGFIQNSSRTHQTSRKQIDRNVKLTANLYKHCIFNIIIHTVHVPTVISHLSTTVLNKVQFIVIKTPTCFGTGMTSSGSSLFYFQLHIAALRLIVRSWLDVPTFATRRLHAWYHARVPSGGRWNCGREMPGNVA